PFALRHRPHPPPPPPPPLRPAHGRQGARPLPAHHRLVRAAGRREPRAARPGAAPRGAAPSLARPRRVRRRHGFTAVVFSRFPSTSGGGSRRAGKDEAGRRPAGAPAGPFPPSPVASPAS